MFKSKKTNALALAVLSLALAQHPAVAGESSGYEPSDVRADGLMKENLASVRSAFEAGQILPESLSCGDRCSGSDLAGAYVLSSETEYPSGCALLVSISYVGHRVIEKDSSRDPYGDKLLEQKWVFPIGTKHYDLACNGDQRSQCRQSNTAWGATFDDRTLSLEIDSHVVLTMDGWSGAHSATSRNIQKFEASPDRSGVIVANWKTVEAVDSTEELEKNKLVLESTCIYQRYVGNLTLPDASKPEGKK